jgi:hypothetical protein
MKTLVWEPLGRVSPRQLAGGRVLLHHAAQLVAAVGRSLVPPRPDDGHTSLEWRAEAGALVGQEVPGPRPWRAALRPDEPSLAILARDAEVGRLGLSGRTRAEAFAWIVDRAGDLGAPAERLRLEAPYTIPEHPVGGGAPFAAGADGALTELARWFADGDAVLRAVASAWLVATPVRVWPHHFDVGTVLPLDDRHGEGAPSIGVGLSPGDEGIPEPYFYVTPWPPPPAGSLPDLPAGGRWHRDGWTGALLTGSEVVAAGGGAAQAAAASAFLAGTVELLRARHERGSSS